MTGTFNPYHKWFGIHPKDQPPNHYRLLGVDLFEDDPDVIDAAADQRMTLLRQCANGPHIEHSQRLLNEVAAARLCLLKPDERAGYDAALKVKLPTEQAVVALEEALRKHTEHAPTPPRDGFYPADYEPIPRYIPPPAQPNPPVRKSVSIAAPVVIVTSLLVLLGLGLAIYSVVPRTKPDLTARTDDNEPPKVAGTDHHPSPAPIQREDGSKDEGKLPEFIQNPTFADGFTGWTQEGGASEFHVFTYRGEPAMTTFGDHQDKNTGRIYQQFRIPPNANKLEFGIHGGSHPSLYVALRQGEKTIHRAGNPSNSNKGAKISWNIMELRGKTVTLEIVDHQNLAPWGFIGASNFRLIQDRELE